MRTPVLLVLSSLSLATAAHAGLVTSALVAGNFLEGASVASIERSTRVSPVADIEVDCGYEPNDILCGPRSDPRDVAVIEIDCGYDPPDILCTATSSLAGDLDVLTTRVSGESLWLWVEAGREGRWIGVEP